MKRFVRPINRVIHALGLNADRDAVPGKSILAHHKWAVLAVEAAPDGSGYFSDLRGIDRLT